MLTKLIELKNFQCPSVFNDCRLFCFRMLFFFYGLYPSEEDLIGIGEGLDLFLQNISTLRTKIFLPIGRTLNFEVEYGRKIGIGIHVNIFGAKNIDEDINLLKKKIDMGDPVVVNVDRFYLEYLSITKAHVGFHAVLVVGYDDEKRTLLLIDSLTGFQTVELSYELFYKAATSDCIISTNKMWYHIERQECVPSRSLTSDVVVLSLKHTSERILRESIKPTQRFIGSVKSAISDDLNISKQANKFFEIQSNIFIATFNQQDRSKFFYRKIFLSFLEKNIEIFSKLYQKRLLNCSNRLLEAIQLVNDALTFDAAQCLAAIDAYVKNEQALHQLVLQAIKYGRE